MNTRLRIPFGQAARPSAPGQAGPPRRILVVEDESYIRQFSTVVLLHSGYAVETAEVGAAAWDARLTLVPPPIRAMP